jgi:hypothetical protein
MRWEAVHHDSVWFSLVQQLGRELKFLKDPAPLGLLDLLAHARPNIGVQDVGPFGRPDRVVGYLDPAPGIRPDCGGPVEDRLYRLEATWASSFNALKACFGTG